MRVAPPIPLERMLASRAKVLCSAIWVSGRDREEALDNSVFHDTPDALRGLMQVRVDPRGRSVTITVELDAGSVPTLVAAYRALHPTFEADWEQEARRLLALGSVSRSARYVGDQGSVILPSDGTGLKFQPVPVRSALPEAGGQDWPMGDRLPDAPPGFEDAAAAAFDAPEACTAAFLVLHRGRIVAERYASGVGRDTQLESWSMGKSLTATLLGLLVRDGHFDLYEPAPVPEWQGPGDPRARIRVADLLRMSSGLRFSGAQEPRERWEQGVADHMLVYEDSINVFDFSVSRPPEHPPNTVGRYRNCDPLVLGYVIRRTLEAAGEEYLAWPQRALFDAIGIRKQVMETDAYGNFILTGYDYGTARNWARLGLLYAGDGVWNGQRLLPQGFVGFVRTPAPAWARPEYGGLFWVNGTGKYELPRDAFYMAGAGEQRVFVVPSHELVVVRLGHRRGADAAGVPLNRALARVITAAGARTAAPR